MMLKISINLHQILFVVILIHTVQCKVTLDQDSSSHRHQASNKIKDSPLCNFYRSPTNSVTQSFTQ